MSCELRASTMLDLLAQQASEHREDTAYVFLDDRSRPNEITYGQLECRAQAIAAHLQSCVQPGDRALLVYPAGLDFVAAFFGCLYAGVIAVPATYPKPRRPMPRLNRIAADCGATVALTTAQTLETVDRGQAGDEIAHLQWIATDTVEDRLAQDWSVPNVSADDLAFLQYTSGSTSDPKGVMVSHGNLLSNLEAIRQAFGIGQVEADLETSTGVFWLPAYHDMGLIGGVLTPLYVGGRSVLLAPPSFLRQPLRWLETISDYRATISGAPNFAYELAVEKTTPDQRAALDLSCWRLAFCGAEPIRAETLSGFCDAFRTAGFRANSLYPCYGLAESTLLAAGPNYAEEPTILPVDRAALAEHRVVLAGSDPAQQVQRLVGCGAAMDEHQLIVVSPGTTTPCDVDEVGEILVAGPSVTHGYWERPDDTQGVFGVRLPGRDANFLRTGDLGFVHDGELYVTGRLKDVIIIRGRNHYPQDIEETVSLSHPAVLMGAAFSLPVEGEERLVVVHQVDRQHRGEDWESVARTIRRNIVEQHELDAHAIVLIRQTSLPITSSGKVQRSLCREQYLAAELKVVHEWKNRVLPRSSQNGKPHTNGAANKAGMKSDIHALHVDRAAERIEVWLLEWLVERVGLDAADVRHDRPFAEYGVDSLASVELSQELEKEFDVELTPVVAWNYPTAAALARYLAEQATGQSASAGKSNGAVRDEAQIEDLLAEIENLTDEEAAQLLAEEG